MNDDNALSGRSRIDGATDAVLPHHAHFPEFPFEVLDVWLVHGCEAMLLNELRDAEKSLSYVFGQSVEFTRYSPIQDLDPLGHCPNGISKKRSGPADFRLRRLDADIDGKGHLATEKGPSRDHPGARRRSCP